MTTNVHNLMNNDPDRIEVTNLNLQMTYVCICKCSWKKKKNLEIHFTYLVTRILLHF